MTQEMLTPTEKLKKLRDIAKALSEVLGKVVIYDDETTENLLEEAEKHALAILQTLHDENPEEVVTAVLYHINLQARETYNTERSNA